MAYQVRKPREEPLQAKAKVDDAGRLLIPAEIRKALGIEPGKYVVMRVEDNELRIWTFDETIRRVQESVRRYIPEGVSLSDELIAERRREAERE